MTPTDYRIEVTSLRSAVQHLRTIDLAELATAAIHHGTEAERDLIEAVRQVLPALPSTHP